MQAKLSTLISDGDFQATLLEGDEGSFTLENGKTVQVRLYLVLVHEQLAA
jgi:hypothetical protein